eukprot:jgi/Chlat1/2124/Chrsp17S02706
MAAVLPPSDNVHEQQQAPQVIRCFEVKLKGVGEVVSWKKLCNAASSAAAVGKPASAAGGTHADAAAAGQRAPNAAAALEARLAGKSPAEALPPAQPSQANPTEGNGAGAPSPSRPAFEAPPVGVNRMASVVANLENYYKAPDSDEDMPAAEAEGGKHAVHSDYYDTDDSFIDDAELNDYCRATARKTKYNGYFVNNGQLESDELPRRAVKKMKKVVKRRRVDEQGPTIETTKQPKGLKPEGEQAAAGVPAAALKVVRKLKLKPLTALAEGARPSAQAATAATPKVVRKLKLQPLTAFAEGARPSAEPATRADIGTREDCAANDTSCGQPTQSLQQMKAVARFSSAPLLKSAAGECGTAPSNDGSTDLLAKKLTKDGRPKKKPGRKPGQSNRTNGSAQPASTAALAPSTSKPEEREFTQLAVLASPATLLGLSKSPTVGSRPNLSLGAGPAETSPQQVSSEKYKRRRSSDQPASASKKSSKYEAMLNTAIEELKAEVGKQQLRREDSGDAATTPQPEGDMQLKKQRLAWRSLDKVMDRVTALARQTSHEGRVEARIIDKLMAFLSPYINKASLKARIKRRQSMCAQALGRQSANLCAMREQLKARLQQDVDAQHSEQANVTSGPTADAAPPHQGDISATVSAYHWKKDVEKQVHRLVSAELEAAVFSGQVDASSPKLLSSIYASVSEHWPAACKVAATDVKEACHRASRILGRVNKRVKQVCNGTTKAPRPRSRQKHTLAAPPPATAPAVSPSAPADSDHVTMSDTQGTEASTETDNETKALARAGHSVYSTGD